MDLMQFIAEANLAVVAVLWALGEVIKHMDGLKDKFIPIVLVMVGIGLMVWQDGLMPMSVMQGILCAGAAVLADQMAKQAGKDE